MKEHIIFGTYFFLDDEIMIHTRTLDSIVDALSNIGGFLSVIFGIFLALVKRINDKWLIDRAIRNLYRTRDKEHQMNESMDPSESAKL